MHVHFKHFKKPDKTIKCGSTITATSIHRHDRHMTEKTVESDVKSN